MEFLKKGTDCSLAQEFSSFLQKSRKQNKQDDF